MSRRWPILWGTGSLGVALLAAALAYGPWLSDERPPSRTAEKRGAFAVAPLEAGPATFKARGGVGMA